MGEESEVKVKRERKIQPSFLKGRNEASKLFMLKHLNTQVTPWPSSAGECIYTCLHWYHFFFFFFPVILQIGTFRNRNLATFPINQFQWELPYSKWKLKVTNFRTLTTFWFFPWLIWFLFMQAEGKIARPEVLHSQRAITEMKKEKTVTRRREWLWFQFPWNMLWPWYLWDY